MTYIVVALGARTLNETVSKVSIQKFNQNNNCQSKSPRFINHHNCNGTTLTTKNKMSFIPVTLTAVKLEHRILHQEITLIQTHKDILSDLGLMLGSSPSKMVKINLHPFVALLVDRVVLVAQLLACHAVRQRLCLRGGSVFVSSADVQCIDVAHTLVPVG